MTKLHKIKHAEHGYTLITTALVIIVIGLIISSLSYVYLIYNHKNKTEESDTHITKVREAIDRYVAINGRLPCPAPINATPDHSSFGIAVGTASGCDTIATYSGISSTTGRDGMRVQIGAIPTRTLNLPDLAGLDGWSRRIYYAVTANYTTASADFGKNNGAITLQDGVDTDGNPRHVTSSPSNAIYILIAPGADDRGAYAASGELLQSCDRNTYAGENCNNDATFNLSMNHSYNLEGNCHGECYTNIYHFRAGVDIFKWDVQYGACTCPTKTRPTIVRCLNSDDDVVPDENCLSARPDDSPQDCAAEPEVNNCFGWYTPDWPAACPCGTTQTRTSTCNQRDRNNGAFILTNTPAVSTRSSNPNCKLVNAAKSVTAINDPIHCTREGDAEPSPNPESRTCNACPPPPTRDDDEGGDRGNGDGNESDPLVIDLNGDGMVELSSRENGVQFDIDDDGIKDQTAWIGCNDGLLFIDENNDGVVTNHSELFGNNEMGAYEELGLHDSNGNGKIDAEDRNYSKIMVWQDVNSDGISQASEMTSLADHNISEVNVGHEEIEERIEGNRVSGQGVFKRIIDGIVETVAKTIETFFQFFKG